MPVSKSFSSKPRDDLLGGQPFRDRELMLHHLAVDHGLGDVARARTLRELILAEFQIVAARLQRHRAADEDPRIADHALAREQFTDVANAERRAEC